MAGTQFVVNQATPFFGAEYYVCGQTGECVSHGLPNCEDPENSDCTSGSRRPLRGLGTVSLSPLPPSEDGGYDLGPLTRHRQATNLEIISVRSTSMPWKHPHHSMKRSGTPQHTTHRQEAPQHITSRHTIEHSNHMASHRGTPLPHYASPRSGVQVIAPGFSRGIRSKQPFKRRRARQGSSSV